MIKAPSSARNCRVGSFFLLSTVPSARGLGIGSYLTLRALEVLRDAHHTHCVIEASPQGVPIYKAIGFEHLPHSDFLINVSNATRAPKLFRLLGSLAERLLAIDVDEFTPAPQRAAQLTRSVCLCVIFFAVKWLL